MPLTITDVEPAEIAEDGGALLRVAGTFDLGVAYEVRLDSVSGPHCLSGRPGQMRTCYALTVQEIRCYAPIAAQGAHDVVVRRVDGAEPPATLAAGLTVYPREFATTVHAVRKVFPPFYDLGPRSVRQEA